MKKSLKGLKSTLSTIIVIAIIFGGGCFAGMLFAKNGKAVCVAGIGNAGLRLPGEVEKMVITVDEVRAKIREIEELTSCEGTYVVTKGQDFKRYMLDDIPIPGTTNHIELTCTGVVKAGYNLEDIAVRVDNDSQKIYVSLPKAKIASNQLMWDSSMECRERNNILNPIDFEQYRALIADIKVEGQQEAENNGLYEAVKQNAKKLITNFLGCFAGYEVVFL